MSAPHSDSFVLPPLSPVLVEPAVRAALAEDLGTGGDMTTDNVVPESARAEIAIVPRKPGRVAGLDLALTAFRLIDPRIQVETLVRDGGAAVPGQPIALVSGPGRGVLTAERVALNFLGHLSGIATATAALVTELAGTGVRLADTRKTTPGLRLLEKYAVRCGGGVNHRLGLDDAAMLKENHLAWSVGIGSAILAVRAAAPWPARVIVEAETESEAQAAVRAGADAVLLAEFSPEALRALVPRLRALAAERGAAVGSGALVLEASGVRPEQLRAYGATGIDLISSSAPVTRSPWLDLSMRFEPVLA
jgi:nicotinate-nucleotide pyrophosphorylase (carboxylating)